LNGYMSHLRIAFLTTEFISEPYFAGGLANYLVRTALSLLQFDCIPVIFVKSDRDEQVTFRGITVFRVRPIAPWWIKIADILSFKKLSWPLTMVSASRALWQRVEDEHAKIPFDIVQASSYNFTNLYTGKHIPSVVRLSSFEPLWRKAYKKPITVAQFLFERLEKRAIKKAVAVYGPSSAIAEHVSKRLNLPVSVIEPPFEVDAHAYDNTLYAERLQDKKYLLFYGAIGLLKGCRVIADILTPLLSAHKDLYFVFIGRTEKIGKESFNDYIKYNSPTVLNRILVLPPVTHEQLFPVIKNAQAVVLPSVIDNLPNTCIESMALGQIVVGTRGASFEQLITDGISGFLSEPDNAESLLDAIQKTIRLPDGQRNEMAQNARNRIKEMAPEKAARKLLDLYLKVIDG
jgi:glycosyltransferase involved in cell wall biosynthesis